MKLFSTRTTTAQKENRDWQATDRTGLLTFASSLLHSAQRHPDTVLAIARCLQAWVEEGSDADDRRHRMAALNRAFLNRSAYLPDETEDEPVTFLDEAKRYYEFMVAA